MHSASSFSVIQKKIFRVALAIVREEMEAEFITQDTFVQAYRKLDTFEGRAEFETWLTRIAINRSRDRSAPAGKWSSFINRSPVTKIGASPNRPIPGQTQSGKRCPGN